MDNQHFFADLAKKISDLLPPGVHSLRQDFEKNLKILLHSTFEKMELITRHEFDTQARVLIKTREKLDSLTARVAELEAELEKKHKSKK